MKESIYGDTYDFTKITAGAEGTWAGAGKVPVRAGTEAYPEATLFHGAEAETGGCCPRTSKKFRNNVI